MHVIYDFRAGHLVLGNNWQERWFLLLSSFLSCLWFFISGWRLFHVSMSVGVVRHHLTFYSGSGGSTQDRMSA